MRTTLLRTLTSGLPVAAGLFAVGYLFAQIASMWVGGPPPRVGPVMQTGTASEAAPIAEGLAWRVPLSMAGWGFLLVAGYELLAGLWRSSAPAPAESKPVAAEDPAEALVRQFLRDAESRATNLANTPAPLGSLEPETAEA